MNKTDTKVQLKKKLERIKVASQKSKKKNISKHFGKLKRNIDGLEFQKEVRDEWR